MTGKRETYFDLLNVISCIAVLAMHHNEVVHRAGCPEGIWRQAEFIDILCQFAVPVFFMLSGATLIGYRQKYSTSTFFRKRFFRAFVPFVIMQLVWFCICIFIQNKTEFMSFRGFIDGFINCKFIGAYWFFIPLFLLYLLMPLLSLLPQHARLADYLLALLVLVEAVLLPILRLSSIEVSPYLANPAALPVLYALLGYRLAGSTISVRHQNMVFAAALALFAFKYLVLAGNPPVNVRNAFSLTDPCTLVQASAVFLLAFRLRERLAASDGLSRTLGFLAGCSFGVYLVHMIVIYAGKRLLTGIMDEYSLVWRTLMIPVTYAICVAMVAVYKKSKSRLSGK